VAGRFPILTDSNVRQQIVEALLGRGWDVVRAIDVCPEGTPDEILFERAAKKGRVFVTTDEGIQRIGSAWLRAGRHFRMIFWRQSHHLRATAGDSGRPDPQLCPGGEPGRGNEGV